MMSVRARKANTHAAAAGRLAEGARGVRAGVRPRTSQRKRAAADSVRIEGCQMGAGVCIVGAAECVGELSYAIRIAASVM